jgi:hypothetical protein
MYQITAHNIQSRMNVSRAGIRARRLPAIVLGDGSVIKLSPGRSVLIDERTYETNREFLTQQASLIHVVNMNPSSGSDVEPPAVQYDEIETLEPVEAEPEPAAEPVEEVVELAPLVEPELDADIEAMLAAPEAPAPVQEEPVEEAGRKRRGRRA